MSGFPDAVDVAGGEGEANGMRLLLVGNFAEAYRCIVFPLDSVRHFEMEFFWNRIRELRPARVLDVSSPRLLTLLSLRADARARADLVNPDAKDLERTRRMAHGLAVDDRCRFLGVLVDDLPGDARDYPLVTCMPESPEVARILAEEQARGLDTLAPFEDFARRAAASRDDLRAFLAKAKAEGRTVAALGASTKGNVLLQYCGATIDDIAEVGEVNPDKYGAMTPGTFLPIRAESEVLAHGHDYHIVLPWHFRRHFLANPAYSKRTLVFPLPTLEVVQAGVAPA